MLGYRKDLTDAAGIDMASVPDLGRFRARDAARHDRRRR
jgi:hypothetical protein